MEEKKFKINPMHSKYKFMLSPRCGANARTNNHQPCRAPAVRDKKRCRMHGGAKGSGAPQGNQNALKSGEYTQKAKANKYHIRMLIKQCKETIEHFDDL
jgi:hypothetical protein